MTMTSKILIAALLTAQAAMAAPSNWVVLLDTPKLTAKLDSMNVEPKSKAWIQTTLKGKTKRINTELYLLNCQAGTLAVQQSILQRSLDVEVLNESSPQFSKPGVGSLGEVLLKALCR